MRHKIEVKFIKRLYGTEDGDFSIFSAKPVKDSDKNLVKVDRRFGSFSVSGDFALNNSDLNKIHTVTIEEDFSSKYANSYKLIKLHYELPKDAAGQWRYLEQGGIVPPGTLLSIERHFNPSDKILDIILNHPEKVQEVPGIGEQRALNLQAKLTQDSDKAAIFTEYGDIDGVGDKAIKVLVNWKPSVAETIKSIKADPFSLMANEAFGFMLADKFRSFYKIPLNDRNRILHGVSYYLGERFQDTGNTYEDIFAAARETSRKLFVNNEEVVLLLAEIQKDEKSLDKYQLRIFGRNITTKNLFNAELLIYKKMKQFMTDKEHIASPKKWDLIKANLINKTPQDLSPEQDDFLRMINNERVSLLLGPGGSGKSWVINLACQMINKSGKTFALLAPTARAAHVMSEYVGVEASTIHRALMKHVEGGTTVPQDVLIVDEYSMVDSELSAIVLNAMDESTRLIIVGDDFQLQSVGPGNVLFDLIEFIKVPTIKLTKVFRQSENSKILDYSNALRDGTFKLPNVPRIDNEDIVLINEPNDQRQQEIALKLYKQAYDRYGVQDIMLLSPTNKGVSGRNALNKKVQKIVNPGQSERDVVFGENSQDPDKMTSYKVGDFIAVKKNQYDINTDYGEPSQLINGDLGVLSYTNKKTLTFKVGKLPFTIDKSEVNSLIDHAWTITIHKSQGGQASEVIIVLPKNSYFMLNSNMLYTAITRAKVKCYVIGDFEGINSAAKEQANLSRKTMIQLQTLTNNTQKKD